LAPAYEQTLRGRKGGRKSKKRHTGEPCSPSTVPHSFLKKRGGVVEKRKKKKKKKENTGPQS